MRQDSQKGMQKGMLRGTRKGMKKRLGTGGTGLIATRRRAERASLLTSRLLTDGKNHLRV